MDIVSAHLQAAAYLSAFTLTAYPKCVKFSSGDVMLIFEHGSLLCRICLPPSEYLSLAQLTHNRQQAFLFLCLWAR